MNKIIQPEFLFDIGSPNAYLAHKILPDITARTGVAFRYVPVLLGGIFKATGNQSPFYAYAGIQHKLAYEQLEIQRFVEKHGLHSYALNPDFPQNNLTVMRGAYAAEQLGLFAPYIKTMFHHMWEDHRKLDDMDILRATLVKAGLPADELIALTQDDRIKQSLVDATTRAVERGAFGVPTFFVGDAMWFGKERLPAVEDAIIALRQ